MRSTFCTLTVKHVFFIPLKFTVRVKTCIYLFTKSRIRSKYFLYRTEQVYPTDFEDEGDKNKYINYNCKYNFKNSES